MAAIGSGIGMAFTRVKEQGTKIHASAQILAAVLVILYGCYFLWQTVPSLVGRV
jgi:ABC-type nickel/cobalt efflux system permease component RcnA